MRLSDIGCLTDTGYMVKPVDLDNVAEEIDRGARTTRSLALQHSEAAEHNSAAEQSRAGQSRAGRAGQGRAGPGRAGQGREGQGTAR